MPSNTITGNGQSNNLVGTAADDLIRGRNGDDTIEGGLGNDVLKGGRGDDLMSGGDGDDSLVGGKGADTLEGGPGTDTLEGGDGADVFAVTAASDTIIIKDFENGVDLIDLSTMGIDVNAGPAGSDHWGYLATQDGDTILQFFDTSNGDMVAEVVLEDFNYQDIDITDYIL